MYPLISVIIPVYNSGNKINSCIKSILSQTYTHLEIVLVDDKSPDIKTLEILRSWVKKDSRIHLLEKEKNGGNSRLDGVWMAQGDYLCFVDQDDTIPKDSVQVMYEAAVANNADAVIGQISKSMGGGPIKWSFSPKELLPSTGKVLSHDDLMGEYFESYFGHNILPVSIWGKLFKKELFYKAKFPTPWPRVSESDLLMSMYLHPVINRLAIIPNVVYNYFIGLPGASPKYLNSWLPSACTLFEIKWGVIDDYHFVRGSVFLAIEMVNYIKTFVRNSTVFDRYHRNLHIQQLEHNLKHPIWKRASVLLKTDYQDMKIVNYILKEETSLLYEDLESSILAVSFKLRLKYSILWLFSKLR